MLDELLRRLGHAGYLAYHNPILLLAPLIFISAACIYAFVLKPSYVSPLSKIPAAHWSAHFSPRWMARQRARGRENRTIYAAHQREGSVVRLAPDEVSVMSLEGVRKIYGGNFPRTSWFDEFRNYDGTPNLVTMYGREEHARRRRMVSNVFSKSYIQRSRDFHGLAGVILWERLLPLLVEKAIKGEGVDVWRLGSAIGVDFMSAYEFGVQNGYNLVSSGREDAMNAYFDTAKAKIRGTEGPVKAAAAAKELEEQCMTMIEMTRESMQNGETTDEVPRELGKQASQTAPVAFANLSQTLFAKEVGMSTQEALKEVASEMLDNIEAAREGIGLTLTYVMHELSRNPSIQAELRKELRDTFMANPQVAVEHFDTDILRANDHMPLLEAVVLETLRIRPAAPGPQRREVPPEGTTIEGYYIPGGVTIHAAAYCMNRHATAFPDAESWLPKRWLHPSHDEAKGEKDEILRAGVGNLQSYLFTFSSGARTCLGNNFATIVTKIVLALIYINFETYIIDDEGIEQVDSVAGWPKGDKLILGFKKG